MTMINPFVVIYIVIVGCCYYYGLGEACARHDAYVVERSRPWMPILSISPKEHWHYRHRLLATVPGFLWILEALCRSSCFQGKCCIQWAISPALHGHVWWPSNVLVHELAVTYLSRVLLVSMAVVSRVFLLQIVPRSASTEYVIVHTSDHSFGINAHGQKSEIKPCEHRKGPLAAMQEMSICTPPPGGGRCSLASVLAHGGYFQAF